MKEEKKSERLRACCNLETTCRFPLVCGTRAAWGSSTAAQGTSSIPRGLQHFSPWKSPLECFQIYICLSHCLFLLCSLLDESFYNQVMRAVDAGEWNKWNNADCLKLATQSINSNNCSSFEIDLKLCFVFGHGGAAAAIPCITLTMCDTYSTRRALMLALWFSFWAVHIVQTDAQRQFRILPEVEKDEQINEEGSTLTLTCISDEFNQFSNNLAEQIRWTHPRSEVIKMISI